MYDTRLQPQVCDGVAVLTLTLRTLP
jgi:hypothetical protein